MDNQCPMELCGAMEGLCATAQRHLEQLGRGAQDVEVEGDRLEDAGALHLDGHLGAAVRLRERRLVDLPDRGRGNRGVGDRLEDGPRVAAELLLDDQLGDLAGERLDALLDGREKEGVRSDGVRQRLRSKGTLIE